MLDDLDTGGSLHVGKPPETIAELWALVSGRLDELQGGCPVASVHGPLQPFIDAGVITEEDAARMWPLLQAISESQREEGFAGINGRLDRLDDRLDGMENRIGRVENRLDEVGAEFGEFKQIMRDMQSTQGQMLRMMCEERGIPVVELAGEASVDLEAG